MTEKMKHKYTYTFTSFQGEGTYTGANSAWIRLFSCNLNCRGFMQENPADPSTYEPVGNDFDLINIKQISDLPVFEYGCDTAYAVSQRYKHLVPEKYASEIVEEIEGHLASKYNPNGLFKHPISGQESHFCITGGEPLMRHNQKAIIDILETMSEKNNPPAFITVETNGTQKLSKEFGELITRFETTSEYGGLVDDNRGVCEWFWSVSPKLLNTSGEEARKAIKPERLAEYAELSNHGHLKFVVNGTQQTWDELESVLKEFRDVGITWPVYIMPVGATKEQQEDEHNKAIIYEALNRGYNISGRLHCHLLGNDTQT
jgi:organic radical activating enzyme